jgi:hypothetical protein
MRWRERIVMTSVTIRLDTDQDPSRNLSRRVCDERHSESIPARDQQLTGETVVEQ